MRWFKLLISQYLEIVQYVIFIIIIIIYHNNYGLLQQNWIIIIRHIPKNKYIKFNNTVFVEKRWLLYFNLTSLQISVKAEFCLYRSVRNHVDMEISAIYALPGDREVNTHAPGYVRPGEVRPVAIDVPVQVTFQQPCIFCSSPECSTYGHRIYMSSVKLKSDSMNVHIWRSEISIVTRSTTRLTELMVT